MFTIDDGVLAEFRRRVAYPNLSKDEMKSLAEEFLPQMKKGEGEYLSHSDNYIKDHARLGWLECKQYIRLMLQEGYLSRDEDGDLGITESGVRYYHDLQNDLERETVKSLNKLAALSLRRRGAGNA